MFTSFVSSVFGVLRRNIFIKSAHRDLDTSLRNMEQQISLDTIRTEIGDIGRAQIFYFALISFIMFSTGCFTMSYVFTAGDLNYRCYIDGCDTNDNQNADYNRGWLKYAVPFDEDTGLPQKCFMYEFVGDRNKSRAMCESRDFNAKSVIKCNKFVFETNEKTILTEFGLTCLENKWKLTLPGTIHSAGIFFNMLMIGYASDRFGRKTVLILASIMQSTCGIGQSLAQNYWWFLTFKFLEPCLGDGTYAAGYLLAVESVSPKYRAAIGAAIFAISSIGEVYLGLVAMFVLNWKILILIIFIPNYVIITYIWLLPESISWLQAKRRHQEIANILLGIIKWNKLEVSAESRDILVNRPQDMFKTNTNPEPNETIENSNKFPIRDLCRSRPMILRILGLALSWLSTILVYYGLSQFSVYIGGNKFISFMITCAMEIPACALFGCTSSHVGRRTILSGAFFVSGAVLVMYTFISDIYWLKMIMFMTGKFAITITVNSVYVYTSEMVPTSLRQTVMGLCSASGRIGSLAAPQAPLFELVMKHLSIYMFAGFALSAGLIALTFPETLNCKLPDTIEEAIHIGKRNR